MENLLKKDSVSIGKELTDEQIATLAHIKAFRYKHSTDPHHGSIYSFNRMCLIDFARAILETGTGTGSQENRHTPESTEEERRLIACRKEKIEPFTVTMQHVDGETLGQQLARLKSENAELKQLTEKLKELSQKLEAELIKESHRTANEKLRADQMTERLRMQRDINRMTEAALLNKKAGS